MTILTDLRAATALLTRVPMSFGSSWQPTTLAHAVRFFPLVGAAIGAVVGMVAIGLIGAGVPRLAAAALAIGFGAIVTGALHEDGLGDVADGFGGGRERADKLAIMRDSRLGTYGTLALLIAFATKIAAIAAIGDAMLFPALVVAFAVPRMTMLLVSALPFARVDGLAAGAGKPDRLSVALAIVLGCAIAGLAVPWREAAFAIGVATLGSAAVALLAWRQIGGQTGDVIGAAEQVGEICILLAFAARLS